jgi:hypothetical protein
MTKRELIERIKDFPDDAEVGLSLVKADGRSVYPDVSVERGLDQVPTAVHARKLDHDLQLLSRQLTEHQLALNLSRRELDALGKQVEDLQDRSERRQRLLGEAYPVLQAAIADGWDTDEFASNGYTLAVFQADIDRLLTE